MTSPHTDKEKTLETNPKHHAYSGAPGTDSGQGYPQRPAFWNNSKRYYDLKSFWRNIFGCKVYKLPIDAGFTCPNRDGRIAAGGCTYCDGRGSRLRQAGPLPSVTAQIDKGKAYYTVHRQAGKFVAYFQTFTNTYAEPEELRRLYDEALAQPDILGLSIGTRPDCVPDAVLDMLGDYAKTHHIWLELGLQSIHDRTLAMLNRGHDARTFLDAVERSAGRGIHLCVHLIVGLPGESREDILTTACCLASLPIQGVKIHSLLALQGTVLGRQYENGAIAMLSREEYVSIVCDIIEILPPATVIQRLTADGYKDIFLGPAWAINKMAVLNGIDWELKRRQTWQGCRFTKQDVSYEGKEPPHS